MRGQALEQHGISNRLGAAASAMLLIVAGIGAMEALPVAGPPAKPLAFVLQDAGGPNDGFAKRDAPVFAIAPGGEARRLGQARLSRAGALDVRLYEDGDRDSADLPQGATAVLLKADARLLWAIASDANKAQVRGIIDGLVGDLRRTLESIAASDTFQDAYQDRFQAILGGAMDAAIADPQVDRATDEMLEVLDRAFDKEFVGDYAGIVAKESTQAFLQLIGDSWGILSGQVERNLRERLKQVFNTAEGRALIADRLRVVLATPETADLLTTFARATIAAVVEDPRFLAVIQDLMANSAFADELAAVERSTIKSLQAIARLLVGVDRDDRMHPLAAAALRGLLFDDAPWLVAFVPPERLEALRAAAPGGVIILVARGR